MILEQKQVRELLVRNNSTYIQNTQQKFSVVKDQAV